MCVNVCDVDRHEDDFHFVGVLWLFFKKYNSFGSDLIFPSERKFVKENMLKKTCSCIDECVCVYTYTNRK